MKRIMAAALAATLSVSGCASAQAPAGAAAPRDGAGWTSLFNGRDFTGWRVPAGDNGHWRVVNGVIDYDALSEAPGEKHLWSEREFRDFTLRLDWRIKEYAGLYPIPNVRPDGGLLLVEADNQSVSTTANQCRQWSLDAAVVG